MNSPAVVSAPVLDAVREDRRWTTGYNPSTDEIDAVLRAALLRPDSIL